MLSLKYHPCAAALVIAACLLIGDSEADGVRVLRKRSSQRIELVASGKLDATEIAATDARLYEPYGLAFDQFGSMWLVEMSEGNRLLKIGEIKCDGGSF